MHVTDVAFALVEAYLRASKPCIEKALFQQLQCSDQKKSYFYSHSNNSPDMALQTYSSSCDKKSLLKNMSKGIAVW